MYKKIMVPLDGSELAECVLPHVRGFIGSCQVNSIVFVRAVKPEPMHTQGAYATGEVNIEIMENSRQQVEEERKRLAKEYLGGVADEMKADGVTVQTEVLVGRVAETLIDYTEANNVDLILIATHGRSGVSRWVRGSIADRILRGASIPILMVRAPGTL